MSKSMKKRMFAVALIFMAVILFVTAKLGYEQFIHAPKLEYSALNARLREIDIKANRGAIYDRNGKALAISIATDSVYINPKIVREADGLALSSRNVRLTPEHREAAPMIRRSLLAAAESYVAGAEAQDICARVKDTLENIPGVRCDYVELVDADTLHAVSAPERLALLAVAAWFGDVRLIDNIELSRS